MVTAPRAWFLRGVPSRPTDGGHRCLHLPDTRRRHTIVVLEENLETRSKALTARAPNFLLFPHCIIADKRKKVFKILHRTVVSSTLFIGSPPSIAKTKTQKQMENNQQCHLSKNPGRCPGGRCVFHGPPGGQVLLLQF